MANDISLVLIHGSYSYDVSELVQTIKWGGRKGAASRSLSVTLVDDDGHGHSRSGLDVTEGWSCIFKYKSAELFRGLIVTMSQTSKSKNLTFKAYDLGVYLSNNKDTYKYKNKTADQIFRDICKKYSIPCGDVAKCSYKIKEYTKPKTTAWDALCDALATDYKHTKTRHYVIAEAGKLKLLKRKENVQVWVIEEGGNLTSYTYTMSIEDVKTRVKLLSKKGKTAATEKDSSLEKKLGVFQDVEKLSDSYSKAAVKRLAKSMLSDKKQPERTLTVEALGIPSVISGIGVYVIIKRLGLKRVFYVDADTHTFTMRSHVMSLTLNYADDFEYD